MSPLPRWRWRTSPRHGDRHGDRRRARHRGRHRVRRRDRDRERRKRVLSVHGPFLSTALALSLGVACRATLPLSPGATGGHLELVTRIAGEARNGELGFRFGSPRDVDGDGISEIAAGARFTDLEFTQMGTVTVRASDSGRELAYWEGHTRDALFGHAVLIGPDADGDGRPDVVASAPNGNYSNRNRGVLYTRSAISGRLLWSVIGEPDESFGWSMDSAGDHNADGTEDLLVGSPAARGGKVYLLSGRDGSTLRSFASTEPDDQFGWHVSAVGDLDGDGLDDVLVGAPTARNEGVPAGAAHVLSSATGRRLQTWRGREAEGVFGQMLDGLPDIDGDGKADVVIGAPHRSVRPVEEWPPGEVFVFSGASGARLFHWVGRREGELYGRGLASAGDADGDGVADIAIGAPWNRSGDLERAGYFELRSGRSGERLASVQGDRSEMWLGWHLAAARDIGERRETGLLVSALRSEEKGLAGAGALHVYAFRRGHDALSQGTIKRRSRVSDWR